MRNRRILALNSPCCATFVETALDDAAIQTFQTCVRLDIVKDLQGLLTRANFLVIFTTKCAIFKGKTEC